MVNNSRLKCKLKKFHLSLAGIFRPFFVQKNKNIQHINEGRKSPAKQLSAGNNYSLTSCVGSNPRSCTALSLIDGRETRPRLVHASIARGITASLVSLCEAWLRAGTASYQHKRL